MVGLLVQAGFFLDGSRVNAAVLVVIHNNIAWEASRS